jgi:Membrane protease subunits, stomatin/prohibitin homologs
MSMKALIFSVIGLLVLGSISGAVYYVDERERAIKLRFGALIESNIQPGSQNYKCASSFDCYKCFLMPEC